MAEVLGEGKLQDSILRQLLEHTKLWDFEDSEDQKEILQNILDAEVKICEIPLRIREAEFQPQIREAEIKAETEIKKAEIEADAKVRAAIKSAQAEHRWRSHLIWAIVLIGMGILAVTKWPII